MKQAFSWVVFLIVMAAVVVVAGPASLGGPASYVIVAGASMEPTYDDGDLVVAYERDTYAVGDVIVYDAPVDGQFNVIHRITEPTEGGFVTQGDNRDEPDGWIAPDERIFGSSLFHIPKGGSLVSLLRSPAALAGLAAAWVFLAVGKRDERRSDAVEKTTS